MLLGVAGYSVIQGNNKNLPVSTKPLLRDLSDHTTESLQITSWFVVCFGNKTIRSTRKKKREIPHSLLLSSSRNLLGEIIIAIVGLFQSPKAGEREKKVGGNKGFSESTICGTVLISRRRQGTHCKCGLCLICCWLSLACLFLSLLPAVHDGGGCLCC